MIIDQYINTNRDAFYALCEEHKVNYLFAFGSAVSGNFDTNKSDIDLHVEIDKSDPIKKGEKILSFWEKLEVFFKRKVDLLTNLSVKNKILRENTDSTKVLIYDRFAGL